MLDIFERFEDRPQRSCAKGPVEVLRKALKIDICRVHHSEQLLARVSCDVAGRHGDSLEAGFTAGGCDIDRLSHFLRYEDAQRRDSATADAIERLDETAIDFEDACGAIPVRGLLIEAKRRGLSIERLDLRNSGDMAGDRDRVVGYGAWAIRAG
jgi:AmmeMemoRadiSam system protein B